MVIGILKSFKLLPLIFIYLFLSLESAVFLLDFSVLGLVCFLGLN